MFDVPKLKYSYDALEPYLSHEIVRFHYGKHTKKYFDTMNELIKGTIFDKAKTLDDLISKKSLVRADSALFNNTAQAWNHQFYWDCLTPADKSGKPSDELKEEMSLAGGSYNKFIEFFNDGASKHFGSGWCWMVWNKDKIQSFCTHDAVNPITDDKGIPLFVVDVWEHAYYLDYKNDRARYLENIWNIVNWEFVNERFTTARGK